MWLSEIPGDTSITIMKDVYGPLLEGDKRTAALQIRRYPTMSEFVGPVHTPGNTGPTVSD
jgi:hypothetical protein